VTTTVIDGKNVVEVEVTNVVGPPGTACDASHRTYEENINLGKDFEPGHHVPRQLAGQRDHGLKHTVDAHPHEQRCLVRLKVDIAGPGLGALIEKDVDQFSDVLRPLAKQRG
jgi:hypothetical protein